MEILRQKFVSADALRAAWDDSLPHGGLFAATTRKIMPQTPVVLELRGRALPERVLLRGTVATVQSALPRNRVRAGALVVFDEAERSTVEFLLATMRGEDGPRRRRRAPRLPVSLPVRCRRVGHAESWSAELVDFSVDGMCLRTTEPAPSGTRLVVQLPVPGMVAPLELEGVVASVSADGTRLGVKLERRAGCGVNHVREVLRRLRAS